MARPKSAKAPKEPKAPKPAADKSRGQKIAESQRRNGEMRDVIAAMSTLQLKNFVKRFKPDDVANLKKAIAQYEASIAEERKAEIAKQIEKLKAELQGL